MINNMKQFIRKIEEHVNLYGERKIELSEAMDGSIILIVSFVIKTMNWKRLLLMNAGVKDVSKEKWRIQYETENV